MVASHWPLTGRAAELAAVGAALARRGGVVIAGEPGVGKSRLAREAVGASGGVSRWVVASVSLRDVPFGAFASMLGPPADDETADVLGRATVALRSLGRQTVLCVDDAHLLDGVSAGLVHALAIDRALRLVVTVRAGEPAPDAVTALWKDRLVERVDLAALDEQNTGALVQAALGGLVEVETRRRLFASTRGNILWLRHLVEGERAAGRLASTLGTWRWSGEAELSPALRDLIDARIGRVSEPLRHVLELVAYGEPLGVDLLSFLVDRDAVDEAAERGLIVVEPDHRRWPVRLGHPLYGEAVRSRADPLRARRRRHELIGSLERTGRRVEDTLRRAVLALDDPSGDPELFLSAGAEAAARTDWVLADRLFRAARDAGAGFAAHLALGLLLSWAHRPEEGDVELIRAVELAEDDGQRSRAALALALHRHLVLHRPDDALALLRRTEQELPAGPARDDLRAARALIALAEGRTAEGVDDASRVLSSAGSSPVAAAWAGYALVGAGALAGHVDGLDDVVDRAIAAARRTPDTAMVPYNIRTFHLIGLGLAAHPDRAARTETLRAQLQDAYGPHVVMVRAAFGARLALDDGRVRTAARLYAELRPFFWGSAGGWTSLFEASHAMALAMGGDAAGAREAFARADEFRPPGMRFVDPDLALAGAWVAAAEGTVITARERARDAAEVARDCGQCAVEVVARHAAVCFGDLDQAARLAELAGTVDGPRAPSAAAHAAAWAARDVEGLEDASRELERHGLLLPAADAAAQATTVAREQGRTADSVSALGRAIELGRRCESARTPALIAGGSSLPLSAREREVAMLAGTRSNKEIGARLQVSVRTVEGHVYRACSRLGVSDREALTALVADETATLCDQAAPPTRVPRTGNNR